jgi:hypothetical protein
MSEVKIFRLSTGEDVIGQKIRKQYHRIYTNKTTICNSTYAI